MVSKRDEESQKRHGVLSPVSYQFPYDSEEFDDDGKPRRTGTFSLPPYQSSFLNFAKFKW